MHQLAMDIKYQRPGFYRDMSFLKETKDFISYHGHQKTRETLKMVYVNLHHIQLYVNSIVVLVQQHRLEQAFYQIVQLTIRPKVCGILKLLE